jgi:ribonuclease BN (tRNA processing enzyme)
VDFTEGADMLVSDAQYLPSEYRSKAGWGHSTTHHVLNMAVKAGVKKLFFFHHEPMRSDDELDRIMEFYRNRIREKNLPIEVYAAAEGMAFEA